MSENESNVVSSEGIDPRTTYWRSLDQLRQTPQFEEFMHREFPQSASELPEGVSRRRWMQLMGASLALVGATGCRWQEEEFLPFAQRGPNYVPGEPEFFATMHELRGYARGLVVRQFDGRPIKIEGNPEHPQSGNPEELPADTPLRSPKKHGATDAFAQASILALYDPDRIGGPRDFVNGKWNERSWGDAEAVIRQLAGGDSSKLRILAGASLSPSRARLEKAIVKKFPGSKWIEYESISGQNFEFGAELAFGKRLRPIYQFEKADIILSLDGDPFGGAPDQINQARGWATRRDPADGEMNRLYVVESRFSATGAAADHRETMPSSRIPAFLDELEAAIGEAEKGEVATDDLFIKALALDLVEHKGSGLIYVGARQPAEVHARVHRLNGRLGNLNQTVEFQGVEGSQRPPYTEAIASLAKEMQSGAVETLIILQGNPAYDSPGDVPFAEALKKVPNTIHLSDYRNETSELCGWNLPAAHPLESWGDGVSYEGVLTMQQPLIAPLHDGKSVLEFLAMWLGEGPREGQKIVRETHGLSDPAWRQALHDGFVLNKKPVVVKASLVKAAATASKPAVAPHNPEGDTFEIVFCESEQVFDGRYSNNGWLQETPQFLSKLTWDNAAIMSVTDAENLGVGLQDVVTVTLDGESIDLPVYILPGQTDGSIAVEIGYGRTKAGLVGGYIDENGAEIAPPVGVDINRWRKTARMEFATGATVKPKPGAFYPLATAQDHFVMDTIGLEEIAKRTPSLVRESTPELMAKHPEMIEHAVHHPPLESLWDSPRYDIDHAWGLSVDLSKCVGCNACIVACQSENNVPIVGKDQVHRGREMHWLRVDRYFRGNPRLSKNPVSKTTQKADSPRSVVVSGQPVLCMHCEHAPCESVCPVAATVHDHEGLNVMVYNRCIGTRYCNNNCPYKVRRFNFFNWNEEPVNKKYLGLNVLSEGDVAEEKAENRNLAGMVYNPEVTVRSRGVMEKCTYCIQRIQVAKIESRNQGMKNGEPNRKVPDGMIQTACQQTCPTGAIVFGDLSDKNSRVSQLHYMSEHRHPRAYGMLAEMNVRPRTAYLARIRNPHPLLAPYEPYSIPAVHHGAHEHDETPPGTSAHEHPA